MTSLLCLSSSPLSHTARLATPLLIPSSSILLSKLHTTRSNPLKPWKPNNNINNTKTQTSSLVNVKAKNPHFPALPSSSPSSLLSLRARVLGSTSSISNVLGNQYTNNNNAKSIYQQNKRFFHATRPLHAGAGAFRLANFVAPIIMRQIRVWIGTPSTNAHFGRRLMIFMALLLGLPGLYIYTHLESTPYTERVRFVALTSEDEHKIAEMAFDQLYDTHEADFIPEKHRFVTQVNVVADRIIAATERPDINWEVRVVDSPIHNAFAIPGGKIFVFSGILDVTEDDHGLAFILGHEVAHVLARHSAEQMTVGRLMLGVSVFVSALFGDNIGSFFLGRVISLLTELTYSRSMEREADYIGLLLMQKAKYNINEAPRVWERMMKLQGDQGAAFLSTHPSHEERIHDIRKWVEELKAQNQQTDPATLLV